MGNPANLKGACRAITASLLLLFLYTSGVRGKDLKEGIISEKVKGVVVTREGKLPVKSALVYIVKGEEETLTNGKGEFILNTWNRTPFELNIENEGFKPVRVIVNSTSETINIFLEAK